MDRKLTKFSIKLSKILRHTAIKRNIKIDSSGWVLLDDILKCNEFSEITLDDIMTIVNNNNKDRFSLKQSNYKTYIKANQGHSIQKVDNSALKEIKNPEEIMEIVHGTFFDKIKSIKKNGLNKMKRNHIHFAKKKDVKYGLRKNSQVFIRIDVINAMKDGIKFYESENQVILSPGIDGIIPCKYLLFDI